jgi:tetratricopeptide (TPR) repeat protein
VSHPSHLRLSRYKLIQIRKTEIAIEYCYQLAYSHPSSLIFWIPCETIAKIDAAFVDVARSLRLPGHDDPYTNKTALVCHYLLQQVHPSWLLVMDNADDEDCLKQGEFPLARFVSNLSTGSVLVTTRYRGVASLLTGGKASKGILVPQLPPDDALELFRSKLPVLSETDVPIGLRIVAILEYLPLCITQAAAYIDQCETSLQDYHAELEASDASLMQSLKEDYPDARRGFEAPNSILKTWKASFEKIRTRSKQASHLLAIMGFLDRQDINRDLLRNIFDTPAQLNQALGILRGFCLILDGPSQASYRMHRLVQLAIRFWLSEKLIEFEAVAFKLIYDTFCTITGDTTRQQRLVPHARLVETYTSLPGTYDLELATLRHCIALHDYDIGQYSAALKHCKEAYLQRSRLLGDAHISTLHSKGYMAVIMREQRQFADACVLQQEVLNVKKALLGTDDLDTVDTMHDLASVLERNGDDEKSYSLAAKALQARQRQLGVSDPKTLQSSMLVALLLRKRGDYQESEKLYREALDSFEKILPQNHESTLNCTASLAELLRERGCYDEALQLSSRVFKGKEETLGPEHPRTLLVKNNFALCCHRCGRTEEAETLLRSICITHERFGRHDHADALQAYSNLSIMLCDLQKYDESVELTRRALEGRTKAFGFEHRDTVSTAAELAFTLCKMRRYEEAEILANQVIRIRQRTLGEQHALTLNTLTTLARIMKNTGRVDEALVVFGIILDGRKKIFGAKHPLTREICGELASLPE